MRVEFQNKTGSPKTEKTKTKHDYKPELVPHALCSNV